MPVTSSADCAISLWLVNCTITRQEYHSEGLLPGQFGTLSGVWGSYQRPGNPCTGKSLPPTLLYLCNMQPTSWRAELRERLGKCIASRITTGNTLPSLVPASS